MALPNKEQVRKSITPRERKRLRRNVLIWQGRLDRAGEMRDFYLEDVGDRSLSKEDRSYARKRLKETEADQTDCREKLAEAEAELFAAMNAVQRGEAV